ncbi:MAG: hypothetical protein LBU89_10980 [Fibromonadaceae bacterium]|nr:hypothetical protein [Fibromonadaceae bacterium]
MDLINYFSIYVKNKIELDNRTLNELMALRPWPQKYKKEYNDNGLFIKSLKKFMEYCEEKNSPKHLKEIKDFCNAIKNEKTEKN